MESLLSIIWLIVSKSFGNFVASLETWIPIVLSGLLVLLYKQQKNILEEDHISDVKIEGYRGGAKEWGSNPNYIQVKLSNIGKGIAKDFKLKTKVNTGELDEGIKNTRSMSRNVGGQKEWVRGDADYLDGKEQDIVLESLLILNYYDKENDSRYGGSISSFSEGISQTDSNEYEVTAWVTYTDQLGEQHEKLLFHYTGLDTDKQIESVNELFLEGYNPMHPDIHDYVLPPNKKLGESSFEDIDEENKED